MSIGKSVKGLLAAAATAAGLLLVTSISSEVLDIPLAVGGFLAFFLGALLIGGSLGATLLGGFQLLRINKLVSSLCAGGATGVLSLLAIAHLMGVSLTFLKDYWSVPYFFVTGVLSGLVFWLVVYQKPDESEMTELRLGKG